MRYEFAPGRGQIHAHLLAVSKDNSIYTECYELLKQQDGKTLRDQRLAEFAEKKYGLVACVDKSFDHITEEEQRSALTMRFTDLPKRQDSPHIDWQRLAKATMVHQCSAFCMRKGNG